MKVYADNWEVDGDLLHQEKEMLTGREFIKKKMFFGFIHYL